MLAMINKFKLGLFAVAAAALMLQVPGMASAQGTPARNLANTVWVGGEDITGRPTKLGFAFKADGGAVMIDDVTAGEVRGNWKQSGDQVTITFGNCVYTGRIAGNILAGTARMTDRDGMWAFAVTFAPPK